MGGTNYQALLDDLRAKFGEEKRQEFNRENILCLLDSLFEHLSPALAIPETTLDDGTKVVLEHPAASLLRHLSFAIRDLDTGLTDDVFVPYSAGANHTRPWRTNLQDRALIELIEIIHSMHKHKTWTKTFDMVARALRRNGYKRKGSRLNRMQVKDLYYRYKNQ